MHSVVDAVILQKKRNATTHNTGRPKVKRMKLI
jgi:hypothetical protein